MGKHFLITGSTGFLGKRLVEEILNHGYRLSAIIRNGTDISVLGVRVSNITFYNKNSQTISEIINECKPDYVIHCAVAYGRNESIEKVFKTNLNMFIDLLNASIQSNVSHFLNTDTFSGKNGDYDYLKPYHLSKRHALEWAKLLIEDSETKFSNLRLEHIYGPKDNKDKFFPKMLDLLVQNVNEIDLTAGSQRRDFIYIDDVVRAYLDIINMQQSSYSEYQVGTGVSTSIKELLQLMKASISNCETKLNFGAIPTRQGEFTESIADTIPLTKVGWKNQVDLKSGISKILDSEQLKAQ